MKEVKIQMFRNYSRDFYQHVVYKFKTKNTAFKDSSLSNFDKFTFAIICGTIYQILVQGKKKNYIIAKNQRTAELQGNLNIFNLLILKIRKTVN